MASVLARMMGGTIPSGVDRRGTLTIDDYKTGYGKLPVIRGISLRVEPGESVALLGANGAGKTTFLRSISGLLKPTGGCVTYGDTDLTGAKPHAILARGVAHVPQGRQVFASQSVRENLLLGARLREDTEGVAADLDYMCTVFPALAEKIKQPAGDLSGGQQQALAIARALMSNPTLLMLDEPSLGLAPRLVDDMSELLRTVQRDRNVGILLVEQDTWLALELTQRAYFLQRGEIVMERESASLAGDPSAVFAYLGGDPPPAAQGA